ncbi:hypothetical protein M1N12_01780 [Peptococcaceae bacterium]|nr:hypothetical protein [Peptococcaceae bacterium]
MKRYVLLVIITVVLVFTDVVFFRTADAKTIDGDLDKLEKILDYYSKSGFDYVEIPLLFACLMRKNIH